MRTINVIYLIFKEVQVLRHINYPHYVPNEEEICEHVVIYYAQLKKTF